MHRPCSRSPVIRPGVRRGGAHLLFSSLTIRWMVIPISTRRLKSAPGRTPVRKSFSFDSSSIGFPCLPYVCRCRTSSAAETCACPIDGTGWPSSMKGSENVLFLGSFLFIVPDFRVGVPPVPNLYVRETARNRVKDVLKVPLLPLAIGL